MKLGLNPARIGAVFQTKQFGEGCEDDFHGTGLIQFKSLWCYEKMFLGVGERIDRFRSGIEHFHESREMPVHGGEVVTNEAAYKFIGKLFPLQECGCLL